MSAPRLGDILLHMGLLDAAQLRAALCLQRQSGKRLGRLLIESGLCSREDVLEALSRQCGLPTLDVDGALIDQHLASVVPASFAEQYGLVPIRRVGSCPDALLIAAAPPLMPDVLDSLRRLIQMDVVAYIADEEAIERAICRIYRRHLAPPDVGATTKFIRPCEGADVPGVHVLLYGWASAASELLSAWMASLGIAVKAASGGMVRSAGAQDVVVAPLRAMEALLPRGVRLRCRIVVTGNGIRSEQARAKALGAAAFIPEPVQARELMGAVAPLLGVPLPTAGATQPHAAGA